MTPAVVVAVGVGVILVAYLVVTTLTAARSSIVLSSLGLLAISPAVFSFDLDWVQKLLVVAVLLALLVRFGLRRDVAAAIAVVLFTASLLIGLLPSGLPASPLPTALRAWAGFLLPWLFLAVRWRPGDAQGMLRAVMRLPAVTLPIGVALQAAGLWQVVPLDEGTPRLGGAMIPATLALMTVVAVWAAALELVLFDTPRHSAVWLAIDMLVLVGTLTRGGIIAGAIIVLGLGAWSFTRGAAPRARRVARAGLVLLGLLMAVAIPSLLLRSEGNSYEGAFNTSGREQAWPFFLDVWSQSPFTGRGLGFATIATTVYDPYGVQHLTAPHDEYIHLAVDGGLLLLIGFLALLVVVFTRAARAVPRGARVVVLAMAVALATYAATDNPFSTPQFLVPFAITIAALTALPRRESPGSGPVRGRRGVRDRQAPVSAAALTTVGP